MSLERGQFVANIELNDRTGGVDRRIDTVRSKYPRAAASASGWVLVNSGGRAVTSLLTPPSGKVFYIQQIIAHNFGDAANWFQLYDAASYTALPRIIVPGSDTIFLGKNEVDGAAIFRGTVIASFGNSLLQVKLVGLLITSDYEV